LKISVDNRILRVKTRRVWLHPLVGNTGVLALPCYFDTVKIGNHSRGGETRGDNKADDHDMGSIELYIPFGIVDEDSGQLHITFGSSYKTSD